MKKDTRSYIIHLGFSGFPTGMASVQRTLMTFRGLKAAGNNVLIINKISHHQYDREIKMRHTEGIPYVATGWRASKPRGFVLRNINKVSGYLGELYFLFRHRKKIKAAVLYSTYFLEHPYYYFISKLFGFKLTLQYVELFSSIPGRSDFFNRINDRLIDRKLHWFCDGVIAISSLLQEHVQQLAPKLPVIKIPANSDFDYVAKIPASAERNYLMYCGTIYYVEVILFILDLFKRLREEAGYTGNILLIISGDHESNRQQLNQYLSNFAYQDAVIIRSNIPHTELIAGYKSADVLLIPLRKTIQDTARFPHKVGEYTASGRPFISTNTGEIARYFRNQENALLAEEYDLDLYFQLMASVLHLPERLNQIGAAGKATGLQYLDYRAQGQQLHQFIQSL